MSIAFLKSATIQHLLMSDQPVTYVADDRVEESRDEFRVKIATVSLKVRGQENDISVKMGI